MKNRHYFFAGYQEGKPVWAEVSHSGTLYPWPGKREAQAMAKRDGKKAVFHDTETEARACFFKELDLEH